MENPRKALIKPDWSRDQIKAALRDKGYTLAALSRANGKSTGYFAMALQQPMRHAEKIMADIIGVHPSEIWPSRYGPDGRPYQGRFLPENDGLVKRDARQPSFNKTPPLNPLSSKETDSELSPAEILGPQLRAARRAKGWSQGVLSKKIGVPLTTYASYEQGKCVPKVPTMLMLIKVLETKFVFPGSEILDEFLEPGS